MFEPDASIVNNGDLVNPLADGVIYPIYGVKFTPDDGSPPVYMRIHGRFMEKISFIENKSGHGVDISYFKDENSAASMIVKLSLIGKSKRKTPGDYDVEKFGVYDESARFQVTKRIPEQYAKKGMIMAMLQNRRKKSSREVLDEIKGMKWSESVPGASTSLTFEVMDTAKDEYGSFLNYSVGEFDFREVYLLLYQHKSPWWYRISNPLMLRLSADIKNVYSFLSDKYGLNEMKPGDEKVIKGPLEPIQKSVMFEGRHYEFGIDFGDIDYDPFLEYVVKRVK